MRPFVQTLALLIVFGCGYVAGTSPSALEPRAHAQGFGGAAQADEGDEVTKQISAAFAALQSARNLLTQDNRYNSATKSINVSAILAGGVDAVADLEAGRGIDPETFAALYAGQATDEISAELSTDELGRMTYKGKVVRMYSIARLKSMYQERLRYTGREDDTATN